MTSAKYREFSCSCSQEIWLGQGHYVQGKNEHYYSEQSTQYFTDYLSKLKVLWLVELLNQSNFPFIVWNIAITEKYKSQHVLLGIWYSLNDHWKEMKINLSYGAIFSNYYKKLRKMIGRSNYKSFYWLKWDQIDEKRDIDIYNHLIEGFVYYQIHNSQRHLLCNDSTHQSQLFCLLNGKFVFDRRALIKINIYHPKAICHAQFKINLLIFYQMTLTNILGILQSCKIKI